MVKKGREMLDLQSMRVEYKAACLDEKSVQTSPFLQFEDWFAQAQNAKVSEPNGMLLATATQEGIPNIRAVLLKIFGFSGC